MVVVVVVEVCWAGVGRVVVGVVVQVVQACLMGRGVDIVVVLPFGE